MTGSVLNTIVGTAPAAGHRITFCQLGGGSVLPLTDLHQAAGWLAAGLRACGIGAGHRIGVIAANRPEWVLLDLAALRLKAVTAGFEPGKFEPGDELARRYQLNVMFTDRPVRAPGGRVRPLADVPGLIESGRGLPPVPVPLYQPGDVTTIKFTSGSTGEPKGLAATAGSIDGSIAAVQGMFGHGPGDNLFLFLPLSLLQQRYWVYSALCYGHDLTISTYEAAFPALRAAGATVVMGVPAFYETARKLIDGNRVSARDVLGDQIRYLWTGSAPARPELLRFFTEHGMPIYEGYGLNEACIVAKNHPAAHRAGSVGRVLPGKKVMFDADGVISIWSEHPVNTRYEYAAPGESERVFAPDGTVRTGDIGYLDEDGFLYIQGRADDVIVLENGRNVLVRPLEEFLRASAAIEECVVLSDGRSRLVAVVSPASVPARRDAIERRVAEANAAFGGDERIDGLVVAAEPFSIGNGLLTSQLKPRRRRIAARYLSGADGER